MKIAIAGYGLEGRVNYSYFSQKYPDSKIVIADERDEVENLPENVETILGKDAFSQLTDFDLVVRTASLPPRRITTNGKIWSATNEFFAKCPAKIIGVTGTKGKGTTSSLIASIFKASGRTVHLVGNIGLPSLEVLSDIQPDDVIVYELSSFQLWDLKMSPHVAVVLMIEPDHLDVHSDFKDYVNAKAQIAANQTEDDFVIYNPTNTYAKHIALQSSGEARRYAFPDDGGVYVKENNFCVQDTAICSVDSLQLVGQHNVENACAAISAVLAFNPDIENRAIESGLSNFEGLDHRLKFIREVDGVRYYDDNYSSAPGATLAAVKSFEGSQVLIAGGYDKKIDLKDFARSLSDTNNLKHVVLIGETGPVINRLLAENNFTSVTLLDSNATMNEIVSTARLKSSPGDVVVMSPACASFDMFRNFTERGNQFVSAVNGL